MKSMSDSFERSVRLTRRTATVTISARDSSRAAFIRGIVAYLPVPTISRERNERLPKTNGSAAGASAATGGSRVAIAAILSRPGVRRVEQVDVVDQAGRAQTHGGRQR